DLATVNAPTLSVVSGPASDIEAFQHVLEADGIEAQRVAIDIAAHSCLVDPILERFEAFVETLHLAAPQIPIISNRSGKTLEDSDAKDPKYWTKHLRETVYFSGGISTLAKDPSRVFIEVGPGKMLTSLVKAH